MKTRRFGWVLFFLVICDARPVPGQQLKRLDEKPDLIVRNARVYTVDDQFSIKSGFSIRMGRIVSVGDGDSLVSRYPHVRVLDAGGNAIYPGFIDAHAHFLAYGLGLGELNLVGSRSWQQVLDSVRAYAAHTRGWIIGRGWDQNGWKNKDFPAKTALDSLFPNRPVVLSRIDGHADLANQAALDLAGVRPGQLIEGGRLEMIAGKLTGLLIDNAKELVSRHIPKPRLERIEAALLAAQKNCFAVGLTTVDECGLDYSMIAPIKHLQSTGQLSMRLYVMLSDKKENYQYLFTRGIIKTPTLHVRSFKLYADGALGSRGACLLEPYADQPGWHGFLLSPRAHFLQIATEVASKGFQLCTHAIGDSANRVILGVYAAVLGGKNDLRWRIEHAQVVRPEDLASFGRYSIIPSVQPTHATSDESWAGNRLGAKRLKTGYAYRSLLAQNGYLALGTDFPVENINPVLTFYSAVVRKRVGADSLPAFQVENSLSRQEALRGMTIWAAKANVEDQEKGSLAAGKWADFVIVDHDLMVIAPQDIPRVRVLKTFSSGVEVYSRNRD